MVGSTVTLDGTRSSDYNGNSLSYQWAFVSVPTGSSTSLGGADTPNPTFIPDVNGNYTHDQSGRKRWNLSKRSRHGDHIHAELQAGGQRRPGRDGLARPKRGP